MMRDYFFDLADAVGQRLGSNEEYLCTFAGENSEFARLNRNRVRQAGVVEQKRMGLELVRGKRHARGSLTLSGHFSEDRMRLAGFVEKQREILSQVPDDPLFMVATTVTSSDQSSEDTAPGGDWALENIHSACDGKDLVGIYASGGIHRGFANSRGQRNWFSSYSFNFDWSFYHSADKAVKQSYAGFEWKQDAFLEKVTLASEQLSALGQTPKSVKPGKYRVYLAPAAMDELMGTLTWSGFGLRDHRTKATSLLRMLEGKASFASEITLGEHTAAGIAPNFQGQGFIRPPSVALIENGKLTGCLVSPRSAAEYDVPTNGAIDAETPLSLDMQAGSLRADNALTELGTGVFVSNLWYLNYSDRASCRTTGMTRFATFWVEDGVFEAPLSVMRFDDTFYRMLGENLVGLTEERDFIFDSSTYEQRSVISRRLPGALIDDFAFTL